MQLSPEDGARTDGLATKLTCDSDLKRPPWIRQYFVILGKLGPCAMYCVEADSSW